MESSIVLMNRIAPDDFRKQSHCAQTREHSCLRDHLKFSLLCSIYSSDRSNPTSTSVSCNRNISGADVERAAHVFCIHMSKNF